MVTRKTSRARSRTGARGSDESKIGQAVADSAQKIWLAGLGAFSRARADGDKMFETLVEQGKGLRERARGAADEALKSMRAQAETAGADAAGRWDKLEQVFEDRVSRALSRLGVLTTREVGDLSARVEELNESVRSLMGGNKPSRAPKARRASGTRKKKASAASGTRKKKATRGSRAPRA
jgi:poly(hydroxyalkanoate) granule-associated protein